MLHNIKEQLQLAQNYTTPAERLEELAAATKDKEILQAIARNPNSSPRLLVELAGEYLEEISQNPALELNELEQSDFIDRLLDKYEEKRFYGRWNFPASFLPLAALFASPVRRLAVAANDATPVNILEQLAADPIDLVRDAAKKQLGIDFPLKRSDLQPMDDYQSLMHDSLVVNYSLFPESRSERFNALTYWQYEDFLIEIQLPILYKDSSEAKNDLLNFKSIQPLKNQREFYIAREPNFYFFPRTGEDDILFYHETVEFFQIGSSDPQTRLPTTVKPMSSTVGEWLETINIEVEFEYIAYAIKGRNDRIVCYESVNTPRSFTLSAKNNLL